MLYTTPLMEEAMFGSSVKVDSPSFIWSKKVDSSHIPCLALVLKNPSCPTEDESGIWVEGFLTGCGGAVEEGGSL